MNEQRRWRARPADDGPTHSSAEILEGYQLWGKNGKLRSPHVPATILLANRWVEALGSDIVAAFRSKLANALSVRVEVEPRCTRQK